MVICAAAQFEQLDKKYKPKNCHVAFGGVVQFDHCRVGIKCPMVTVAAAQFEQVWPKPYKYKSKKLWGRRQN